MWNENNKKVNTIKSYKHLFFETTQLIKMTSMDTDVNDCSFEEMSEIYTFIDNSVSQNRKSKNQDEISLNKGDKIHFVDENLKISIFDFLEKPYDSDIYVDDVIDIVELNLSQKKI